MSFKSGFISIIGRPNVGKSTLLNSILGEKIAIMSNKPQTTRNVIKAIVTNEDSQMIFLDTPGYHNPKTKLGEIMVDSVKGTLNEVDAVVWMVEAGDMAVTDANEKLLTMIADLNTPVFLVINKIDSFPKENALAVIDAYKDKMPFKSIIPISAKSGDGVDILMKEIKEILPVGPMFFDSEEITDQPEKSICAEIIREKILMLTNDEVPHGTGVEVLIFKEKDSGIIEIQANVYCEKDSHKGILIGKGGAMLKKIGSSSRMDIENLLGSKVFLQLWVKVKPDWRNKDSVLKTLGYK